MSDAVTPTRIPVTMTGIHMSVTVRSRLLQGVVSPCPNASWKTARL